MKHAWALIVAVFTLGCSSPPAAPSSKIEPLPKFAVDGPVTCQGHYPMHLQGVCVDDRGAIYWSWTDAIAKTDGKGAILKKVAAPKHQGDLCYHADRIYVAVNLGKFNEPAGQADSWVYVYDAQSLELVAKHAVPEVVHGAGGMAYHDGRFIVIGGLPPEVKENYLYEYDEQFHFRGRHVLASGYTLMGIQTATFNNGSWWFGCYGTPKILLGADEKFQFTGRWEFDASQGLAGLPDGRFLVGKSPAQKNIGHAGTVRLARQDEKAGLVLLQK